MQSDQTYVVSSLDTHLFFSRIMKEHALFLKAGFTPRDSGFIQQAGMFQHHFEQLLSQAITLGDGVASRGVLSSGEIVTEFTLGAEQQTARLTGIGIDTALTVRESRLQAGENVQVSRDMVRQVRQLNRTALHLLSGLISFKESILAEVDVCRMFTVNYPLLIEHILREAKLYRDCVMHLEGGLTGPCQSLAQIEQFWNQIMMEHAQFIRGLLDPTETDLMAASNDFADRYATLLARSREVTDKTLVQRESLQETLAFRDFKAAGAEGLQACKIRSIILPLLADHVLREANHYIRLLVQ